MANEQPQKPQKGFIYVFNETGVQLLNAFFNKLDNLQAGEARNFVQIQEALMNPVPKDEYDQMVIADYIGGQAEAPNPPEERTTRTAGDPPLPLGSKQRKKP